MTEPLLPMFADAATYPNAPGFKKRDTAREAAAAIEPQASRLKRLVLAQLASSPMTADDCAYCLGEDKLSIRPRFSELAALGKIEDTGLRGRNASGRKAIVWRLA